MAAALIVDKQRFITLWSESPIEKVNADSVFALLEQRYSEPQRYYHNTEHITRCLKCLDTVADKLEDPVAVELALWFHDIIYDPESNNNEQESADFFRYLVGKQRNTGFINKVFGLILMTAHNLAPMDNDQGYLLDIDLSSFALPWESFKRDSENIRQEYGHLSDQEFSRYHLPFLYELLKRPQLFHSPFFQHNHSETARKNTAKCIKKLNLLL